MPYDLFVSRMPDGECSAWEFYGTYAKLPDAKAAVAYHGHTQPKLRRWQLFYIRRTTGHTGQVHSSGDYPQKEPAHGA